MHMPHAACACACHTPPDTVVPGPQWVLDAMTCAIRDFELHRRAHDDVCRREMPTQWAQLQSRSRLRLELLHKLWADPALPSRFAPHAQQLLHLMVRFSLAVPLRTAQAGSGKEELLIPPLLRFARGADAELVDLDASAERWPELCTLLFMLDTDERAEQLVWQDRSALRDGFVPESTVSQLWAAVLSWSNHTTAGSDATHVSHTVAHVAFGKQRLALRRPADQPFVTVLVQGAISANVLERLRLLLHDVMAKAEHLRCLILLPLRVPGAPDVLVSYARLAAMSSDQVRSSSPHCIGSYSPTCRLLLPYL